LIAFRLTSVLCLAAPGLLLGGCGSPEAPAGGAAAPPPARPAAARPAAPPQASAPQGMVRIPGGTFRMGTDQSPFDFETPAHTVTVRPFYLDVHEVTNAEFARFVKETGYRTVAEQWGWSAIFDTATASWGRMDGADWRHPTGPKSGVKGRDNYPVVQVCYDDAVAYAKWAGKRLPTEAEWEFAARGGLEGKKYPWGDELEPGGKYRANYWQGRFLIPGATLAPGEAAPKDQGKDGYPGIAPVGKFAANGCGLYDMAGNVWEWVHDRFGHDYYRVSPAADPRGPEATPVQPTGPASEEEFVIRGGSFLCAESYCQGYRAAARNKTTRDSATNHQGFRCAMDAP
jgi:formylglycine-generating enzyme